MRVLPSLVLAGALLSTTATVSAAPGGLGGTAGGFSLPSTPANNALGASYTKPNQYSPNTSIATYSGSTATGGSAGRAALQGRVPVGGTAKSPGAGTAVGRASVYGGGGRVGPEPKTGGPVQTKQEASPSAKAPASGTAPAARAGEGAKKTDDGKTRAAGGTSGSAPTWLRPGVTGGQGTRGTGDVARRTGADAAKPTPPTASRSNWDKPQLSSKQQRELKKDENFKLGSN